MNCEYLNPDRKTCSVKGKYLPEWYPHCHYTDYSGLDPFYCTIKLMEQQEKGEKPDFIIKMENEHGT